MTVVKEKSGQRPPAPSNAKDFWTKADLKKKVGVVLPTNETAGGKTPDKWVCHKTERMPGGMKCSKKIILRPRNKRTACNFVGDHCKQ